MPPTTVITHVRRLGERGQAVSRVRVRGTTADNGTVTKVLVNGREAKALNANFAEWEIVLEKVPAGALKLEAVAEDGAGNIEKRPHRLVVK